MAPSRTDKNALYRDYVQGPPDPAHSWVRIALAPVREVGPVETAGGAVSRVPTRTGRCAGRAGRRGGRAPGPACRACLETRPPRPERPAASESLGPLLGCSAPCVPSESLRFVLVYSKRTAQPAGPAPSPKREPRAGGRVTGPGGGTSKVRPGTNRTRCAWTGLGLSSESGPGRPDPPGAYGRGTQRPCR